MERRCVSVESFAYTQHREKLQTDMRTLHVNLADFLCIKSDHSHAQWRECVSCAISEALFMEIPSMADKMTPPKDP